MAGPVGIFSSSSQTDATRPSPPDVLRPLSPSYLQKILELLLMHLVSLSQSRDAASVRELSQSLERDHEVKREVTLQVMRWFGEVDAENESWNVDVEKVVRQVGLGVLRQYNVGGVRNFFSKHMCINMCDPLQNDQVPEDEFMDKWNTAVGDTFTSSTSLQLLSVSTTIFRLLVIRSSFIRHSPGKLPL